MKVVISGSFRKHLNGILQLKQELEKNGIQVLKPDKIHTIENKTNPEFIKFEGEENTSEWSLEFDYLMAIRECDAHIIYNKDSYLGITTCYEFGFNTKQGKTYFLERPNASKLIDAKENIDEREKLDIRDFCSLLNDMEEKGIIKIGIDTLYKDFNIQTVEDVER